MKLKRFVRIALTLLCVALLGSPILLAGSYTIQLTTGETFESRYPPRYDNYTVQFVTRAGDWMTLGQSHVLQVTIDSPVGQTGQMLDSRTTLVGWTANDAPAPPSMGFGQQEAPRPTESVNPIDLLIVYASTRPAPVIQNFSVAQFVDPDQAGGGIPMDGIFRFKAGEEETLIEIFKIPRTQVRTRQQQEEGQGLPVGGFETVQGLPPGGFEEVQGVPPGGFPTPVGQPIGGFQYVQGIVAPSPSGTGGSPPG